MAFNKSRIQIWLNAAIIGFILTLCGQAYAFTGPSASDMPSVLEVEGRQVSLKNLSSPIAESEQTIKEGAEIYIKNCVLCHGDLLDGKGLFGDSFFPRPANFLHPQSVLSKPLSYTYWRIMKGGPGLPECTDVLPQVALGLRWHGQLVCANQWKGP